MNTLLNISKIHEKCICNQPQKYFGTILCKQRCGCRKGCNAHHSCSNRKMEGSVDSSQALTNQILSDVRSCACVLHYLFINVLQAWRGIASNRRRTSAHA